MRDELRDLRTRLRQFLDDEVIPAEDEFLAQSERVGFAHAGVLTDLRASAKRQGLWALGHPTEIGGGGVPFLDFSISTK